MGTFSRLYRIQTGIIEPFPTGGGRIPERVTTMAKRKDAFNRMPEAELIVMQGIWDAERAGLSPVRASELIERYPDTVGEQKLTTVLTLLTRLTERGYLTCEKENRANRYTAAITEEEYRKRAAADFVHNVCRASAGNLLSALVAGGLVEDGDIEELRALMELEKEKEASKPDENA